MSKSIGIQSSGIQFFFQTPVPRKNKRLIKRVKTRIDF
jgi:hypothetical protein